MPGYKIGSEVEKLLHYGADIVYYMSHPLLSSFSTDGYTSAFVQLIQKKKPEIVLVGATSIGRDIGPRIAARLGTGLTADCTKLEIDAEDGKFFRQGLHSEGTLWPPLSAQRTGRRCLR